jgi:hypothetical protein
LQDNPDVFRNATWLDSLSACHTFVCANRNIPIDEFSAAQRHE